MSSMLGKIAHLNATGVTEERSKQSLLDNAKRYYEESLYVARSQSDFMSVLYAMVGLLDVAVESGKEKNVENVCNRIHNIVNIQSIKDYSISDINNAYNSLLKSLELAKEKFPTIADQLNDCQAFLSGLC